MIQILLAFQFLTIFPIRIARAVRDADLVRSMRWYPLVGAMLGGLSAGVFYVTQQLFSPGVSGVAAIMSLVVLSGALHLDGFADMCDGFYGGESRDRVLAIMKDSRSGAMAIIGIFSLLAMKIALLGNLEVSRAERALVLAPAVGRWAMVWLCATSAYARSEGGTASAYIGHVDKKILLIATLLCVGIAYFLFQTKGLLVMTVSVVFAWAFRYYVQERIGGMTGDTLGACSECVEVLVLAAFSIHHISFGL